LKLASLKAGGRDGTLIVVSRDLRRAVRVPEIATTLQAALDSWNTVSGALHNVAASLEADPVEGEFAFDPAAVSSPLPRAYHWVDGSAYVNHVELVRKARGAEMPESFWHEPLVYQGGSDDFLGPLDDIPVPSEEFGIDMEAETAVITDDVPMGTSSDDSQ
jgi:fumarylacetoacetate (FAA) hydrolase